MSDQVAPYGEDDVLALQLRALDKSAPSWVLAIVGGPMMAYPYLATASTFWLLVWMTSVTLVASVALAAIYCRKHHLGPDWSVQKWARLARLNYFMSGCNWGVASCWLLSIGNQSQALVVAGIALSAVTVVVPAVVYREAFNLFQLPIFLGLAGGFITSSLDYNLLLTSGALLMALVVKLISDALGEQLVSALRLSIDNKRLAQRLAQRSAELEVLNKELVIESSTDPLTGVANRRSLMKFARTLRGDHAIILADIDLFKSYNDHYGHVEGDACLVAVAQTLKNSVRPDLDMIARMGGEEFVVVLRNVSELQAIDIAEAIRVSVSALFDARPARVKRQVTISMGVATADAGQPKTLVTLMEEADAALYRAKATGRNRVVVGKAGSTRLAVA